MNKLKDGLMTQKNEFKWIPDWEGYYEIDRNGELFSVARVIEKRDCLGRYYKYFKPRHKISRRTNGNYPHPFSDLNKTIDGERIRKTVYPHKLVGQLFMKNHKNKRYVEVVDGNFDNICPENLRWIDSRELYYKQIHSGSRKHKMDLYKSSSHWQNRGKRKREMALKLMALKLVGDFYTTTIKAERNQVYGVAFGLGMVVSTHEINGVITVIRIA